MSLSSCSKWKVLLAPATRPDRIAKATTVGADPVCLGLEDAVAADGKAAARVLNAPFTSWASPIARAEKFVAAAAVQPGWATSVDGRMIDGPVLCSAQRTMAPGKRTMLQRDPIQP